MEPNHHIDKNDNDPRLPSIRESLTVEQAKIAIARVDALLDARDVKKSSLDSTEKLKDVERVDLLNGESEVLTISRGTDRNSNLKTYTLLLWGPDGQHRFGAVFDKTGTKAEIGNWGESFGEIEATLIRAESLLAAPEAILESCPKSYGV